ncbi:PASTA domain-containing protein [Streptomyces sp. NPDC091219]|uniref:PASTA domain-containing protein n=1 Tax=Streptomyces sp. NPDC091219 TaxID=3155193 RepID=UPI00344BC7BA
MVRGIAAPLVCVLTVSGLAGCGGGVHALAVQAVAAGVPSLAPFFDETQGLGQDASVRSAPVRGSLQQGDTPGLYGGTRKPTVCDVARLKRFLTDPANRRKAVAWSSVLGIGPDRIPGYLDRLTPVVLRHDTLVRNHDYKKGKATPYDSLLQSGIAILVDARGEPAAKCSCGNPLRPFRGDADRISVRFADGNKKWSGYRASSVVAVRPAPTTMERLVLVDVGDPDRGVRRPVGTAGRSDADFDTRTRHAVPELAGRTFGEARQLLVSGGLAVGYDGSAPPSDDARVIASDPPAGTGLRFGEYVTVSVAGTTDGAVTSTPPGPTASTSPTSPTGSTSPTDPATSSGPTLGPPTSTAPPSTASTSPSASSPASEPPPTMSAPITSSAPLTATPGAPGTAGPPTTVET